MNASPPSSRALSRDERIKAGLLFTWFFLTVATLWLLKSVRVTALLIHLGASETPYVRLAGVGAVGGAVLLYSIGTNKLSRGNVVRATSAAFVILLTACWIAVRIGGPAFAAQRAFVWGTYVLVDIYAVVMVQLFWTYTNDVVTPDQANRLYGLIGLGGILGGAFGGALVDACARAIGADNFLLVAAGIVVLCAGMGSLTEFVLKPPPRKRPPIIDHRTVATAFEGIHEVGKSRYLLLIVGVVIGYEFTATLTDFGVNVVFEHAHLSETELAKMYGRLGWIASGVAVVAQLALVPVLLPAKRVALLLPPFALLASVVGVVILPVLATAVVMASVDRGLNYSVQQSTRESLYVPLSDAQKYKAKAFIDMFVDHSAKAVASLLLLVLIMMASASPRVTLILSCGSMAVWIVFARRLGAYATRPVRERRGHTARLVRALMHPRAYAPAIETKHVALHETHFSRVFLLDSDVLKLKKPVDLGFLDLRTLAQRKDACLAEVQLNARLAPNVYRGVVPIRRHAKTYTVGEGEGPIVDWAVHMARLADDGRADKRLAHDTLTKADVDAIARRIAAFHAGARADDQTASYATPEAIAKNVEENFVQTRRMLEHYLSHGDATDVVKFQASFIREHKEAFERRVSRGRIRDGHGDLRLQHVYLDGGDVTIIDCIEFAERFRFADVCSDVACLSMDFAAHGRVDLAERLLSTYASETGDYEIYEVADFYESYRAFVRGKIAALLASDGSKSERARRAAAEEARKYFVLAMVCGRRHLLSPAVVAVGGPESLEKRTVAERIRDETSAAVVVDVDASLLRHANAVLASGRSVVLDASFRSAGMRRAVKKLAEKYEVPFLFVECRAGGSYGEARELAPGEHVVVDTAKPLDATLADIRSRIVTWPQGLSA